MASFMASFGGLSEESNLNQPAKLGSLAFIISRGDVGITIGFSKAVVEGSIPW